jgi:hypothetical protein
VTRACVHVSTRCCHSFHNSNALHSNNHNGSTGSLPSRRDMQTGSPHDGAGARRTWWVVATTTRYRQPNTGHVHEFAGEKDCCKSRMVGTAPTRRAHQRRTPGPATHGWRHRWRAIRESTVAVLGHAGTVRCIQYWHRINLNNISVHGVTLTQVWRSIYSLSQPSPNGG